MKSCTLRVLNPRGLWEQLRDDAAADSLAVRLPAAVVDVLGLKEGDDIEIHAAGERTFEITKTPNTRELLARLRTLLFIPSECG